jgi:hypothetical protein
LKVLLDNTEQQLSDPTFIRILGDCFDGNFDFLAPRATGLLDPLGDAGVGPSLAITEFVHAFGEWILVGCSFIYNFLDKAYVSQ